MFLIFVRRLVPRAVLGALVILVFSGVFISSDQAEAWGHRRWWGPGPGWYHGGYWGWNHGYWFHGAYSGYTGWWWVVGPAWYYYPAPVYPYPPTDGPPPGYIAQNVPPPPAANGEVPAGVKNGTQKAFTYYCASTQSYFPNVKSCSEGWAVSPVKPPP